MRAALLVATSVAFAPKTARLPSTTRARPTTALQMNFFDRFKRVAEANINNVLGKLEDPEKVLNQAVEDLQKDLVTIRQSYAEVMATQKRCARGVPSRRDAFDATRVHLTSMRVVSFPMLRLRAGSSARRTRPTSSPTSGTDGPSWRSRRATTNWRGRLYPENSSKLTRLVH